MPMEFDILTAAMESYQRDLWFWLPGFVCLLSCSAAMGVFIYRRARTKGVRLRSAFYLAATGFVTLFAGVGLCIQHHLLTGDIAQWRAWTESADYTEARGIFGDVVGTETGRIESFTFDGRMFKLSDNPYLQGRHDLLSEGRTFVVRYRGGLILQIEAGDKHGS